MKKILLVIIALLLITGCGVKQYQVAGKKIKLDQAIDFRHLHYTISNSFDYGSEKTYRFYDLYDKKPNVIYRIAIYQIKGNLEKDIEDMPKLDELTKTVEKKYNGKKWKTYSYKENDQKIRVYTRAYDENEYYQIVFTNVEKGEVFETAFMKTVYMDTK